LVVEWSSRASLNWADFKRYWADFRIWTGLRVIAGPILVVRITAAGVWEDSGLLVVSSLEEPVVRSLTPSESDAEEDARSLLTRIE
jgi:hypothetical protein